MRILLDENIPLQLYRHLNDAGHDVEHIITSGRRGLPDSDIRRRLAADDGMVLLTQDTEFLDLPAGGWSHDRFTGPTALTDPSPG